MYKAIDSNKRKTGLLLVLFFFFAMTLVYLLGVSFFQLDTASAFILGFAFSTVYALISYYASDKIALMTAGAKEIEKRDAPELWRLVENLSITAGIPMPKVYIINDPSPNAFATGRDPKHSAVAFTTGLLNILDKKELEGVTAHEISHIKNYDIRVMTVVVVLVGLVVLISDLLIRAPLFRSDENRGGGAQVIAFIVGIVLGLLSPIFAQIIQLAVSRTREYLADASGALLTRYPEGLASALSKISSSDIPLKSANHATAHLFISNPFKAKGLTKLFSTHPPVEDRIARLREMM